MKDDAKNDILHGCEMDVVPRHLFLRDIAGEAGRAESLKTRVLASKLVRQITDQQFDDGSWDFFHTQSAGSQASLTTENALRRLLYLGLDIKDEPIKKAFGYMEKYLKKELDIRDRKEGLSDWREVTELFAAAWMLEIDNDSPIAGGIADKWAELVTRSFTGDTFDRDEYNNAFREIFAAKPGKRAWDIECFHIAAVTAGRLEPEIEEKFVRYILNNDKGIYYVKRGRLTDLPRQFASRETSRFLCGHLLLSRYACYKEMCGFVVDWLMANRGEDGFWDISPAAKDFLFLPLSESWRKAENRKIDSTLFVQMYLCTVVSPRP